MAVRFNQNRGNHIHEMPNCAFEVGNLLANSYLSPSQTADKAQGVSPLHLLLVATTGMRSGTDSYHVTQGRWRE